MPISRFYSALLATAASLLCANSRASALCHSSPANKSMLVGYTARRAFIPPTVADTTVGKVIMVYIRQPGLGNDRSAEFSTDGQRIAGLTAAELNKKFSKNGYAVRVLNFLISNGYRVIGFAPARYGYNYLLEKVH